MSKTISTFLLAAMVVATPLSAASKSAQLGVSVEVVARTILTVDSQPASIAMPQMATLFSSSRSPIRSSAPTSTGETPWRPSVPTALGLPAHISKGRQRAPST